MTSKTQGCTSRKKAKPTPTVKSCFRCDRILPISEFYRDNLNNGYQGACKKCQSKAAKERYSALKKTQKIRLLVKTCICNQKARKPKLKVSREQAKQDWRNNQWNKHVTT